KNDNKMCYWHSNWQYSIIEKKYGIAETGNKTYEVSKQHGDLVYRIDSVVESLAIEFQHTLTVSVNELDYRYKAHKSLGYIPYLVLDLTAFEAKNTILKISDFTVDKIDYYISYSYSSLIISLLKKIRKWLNSDYYKNSSLFIDFSDVMIRFTPILKDDFLVIQKDVFVNNLLNLERNINDLRVAENTEYIKQLKIEEKRIEIENKRKEEKIKIDYSQKIKDNKYDRLHNLSFRFLRNCMTNRDINNYVSKFKNIEYVKHDLFLDYKLLNYIPCRELHIYSFFESILSTPKFEIQYICDKKIFDSDRGYQDEVLLIQEFERESIICLRFVVSNNKLRKVSKYIELARGFLHSITHPAKYEYDIDQNIHSKEYYLFNNKVTFKEFQELSDYFDFGFFEDEKLYLLYKDRIDELTKNDDYYLIQEFCQNYISNSSLKRYYDANDMRMPLTAENY
ncbi:MAG: hypothetical protein ACTJF0_11430, partial [Psychroflexus halocasei]